MNRNPPGFALFLTPLIAAAFLVARPAAAEIIFRDDFEALDPTWNIGEGAPPTPAGYEGSWRLWGRRTCGQMNGNYGGTEDCSALPPYANGWLIFARPSKGYGGGNCVGTSMKNGVKNSYPGTLEYQFGGKYKEIFLGLHIKLEDGFFKKFTSGCKFPFRILTDSPINSGPHSFIQPFWGDLANCAVLMSQPAGPFNGNKKWQTGIHSSDFYEDHAWHWWEFRIKFNTNAETADGEMECFFDGTPRNKISGQRFYTAEHGENLHPWRIWLSMGNCDTCPNNDQTTFDECDDSHHPWENMTWKAILFDNFTVSTTYIGPPPGGLTQPTGVQVKQVEP